MKSLLYLILFKSILISHACGQIKGTSQQPIYDIVKMTKDELPVYIVLNSDNEKFLMTNLELHWALFPDLDVEGSFADTLFTILKSSELELNRLKKADILYSYAIDSSSYIEFKNMNLNEIYKKYFTSKGIPRDSYSEDQIKSVVSYLVENGVLIHQGKYAMYNIYLEPDSRSVPRK